MKTNTTNGIIGLGDIIKIKGMKKARVVHIFDDGSYYAENEELTRIEQTTEVKVVERCRISWA